MKPKKSPIPQNDLFKMRLENIIDLNHELVKLSKNIDWDSFDCEWGKLFKSNKGVPEIATRLIAGLYYLKHLYNLSDEQVVARWVDRGFLLLFWSYQGSK